MNQEIKKMWIDALLSGEYQQGSGRLHSYIEFDDSMLNEKDRNSYCCLGVLCKLAIDNHVPVQRTYGPVYETCVDASLETYHYDGESGVLPSSVIIWAGLHEKNPTIDITLLEKNEEISKRMKEIDMYVDRDEPLEVISEFNDAGFSFQELAKIIEIAL